MFAKRYHAYYSKHQQSQLISFSSQYESNSQADDVNKSSRIASSSLQLKSVSELINHRNNMGMTCCHVANSSKCLEILLQYRGDITILDNDGRNPLFVACALNRPDCVDFLINNLDSQLGYHTKSQLALEYQKCLSETNKEVVTNTNKRNSTNTVDASSLYLMKRDNRGDTPLHAAACNGNVDCLLYLLQYAIDPTIINEKGLLFRLSYSCICLS